MTLNRKALFIIFNIVFIFVIVNFVFNIISTSKDISELKKEEKMINMQIASLNNKKEEKIKEIKSVSDDKAIEKMARDRLNMKKKGEVIYRFVNE